MLLHQRLNLKPNQLIKPHFQNRRRLPLREPKHRRHFLGNLRLELDVIRHAVYQTSLCILHGLAAPQNLDDQVDNIAGLYQSFLNLLLIPLLVQQILVLSGGHLELKIHMMLDNLL